jgi:ABC-type glycerol-3-phosphate transport system permease component
MFLSIGSLYLFPQLQIAKFFGLHTSLWGVIIIRVFSIGVAKLYIARGYINTIPEEIDEAATIDGCSFFRIYWNIILPLLKPLIATVGLLSFRQAWNDYLLPRVFTLGNMNNAPLIVGVINLKNTGEGSTAWNLMIAGTAISIIPMIAVYLFLNKFFIDGLTVGSVKG